MRPCERQSSESKTKRSWLRPFIVFLNRIAGPGGDVSANKLSSASVNAYFCPFTPAVSKPRRLANTEIRHALQMANPDAARERHFANAVERLCL